MPGGISSARSRSEDASCTRTPPMDKVATRRPLADGIRRCHRSSHCGASGALVASRRRVEARRRRRARGLAGAPDAQVLARREHRLFRPQRHARQLRLGVWLARSCFVRLHPSPPSQATQCTPHVLHPPDPHEAADGSADSIGNRRAVGAPAAGCEPDACSAVDAAISSSYPLPPGQYSHSP